ncbi:MAG: cation-transporting P-type ATPase, partial [Clostridia bacterium]|nr:cation-transporting P-type ATPase [Clostridia bacterium]
MTYYFWDKERVIDELSSKNGLTEDVVKERRIKFGVNKLEKQKPPTFLKRLFSAITEPMMLILLLSACVTLGVNVGRLLKTGQADFTEVVGIFLAITVSVA